MVMIQPSGKAKKIAAMVMKNKGVAEVKPKNTGLKPKQLPSLQH